MVLNIAAGCAEAVWFLSLRADITLRGWRSACHSHVKTLFIGLKTTITSL